MMTREEEELGIPFWNFYKAKQKYRKEDEQDAQPGQFVQLSSGRYVPQTMKGFGLHLHPSHTSGASEQLSSTRFSPAAGHTESM